MCDLTGKKFGRWTVIVLHGKRASVPIWYCRCACGNESLVRHPTLTAGTSRSCGCLKSDLAFRRMTEHNPNFKHGHFRKHRVSSTYISFGSMRQRCLNRKATSYAEYGGRGIEICRRWLVKGRAFANFLADMGVRPRGKTLDRINVDGNYTPWNCRWANKTVQQNNRRRMSLRRRLAIRRVAHKVVRLIQYTN